MSAASWRVVVIGVRSPAEAQRIAAGVPAVSQAKKSDATTHTVRRGDTLWKIAGVYDKTGHVRERMGTETHSSVPHSHYQCRDGAWVAIACTNDKMFESLARVMGQPELASPERYGLKKRRVADREVVNGLVTAFTMSHDRDEVIRLCSDGDVPCGKVCSIAVHRDGVARLCLRPEGEIPFGNECTRFAGDDDYGIDESDICASGLCIGSGHCSAPCTSDQDCPGEDFKCRGIVVVYDNRDDINPSNDRFEVVTMCDREPGSGVTCTSNIWILS